VFTWCQVPFVYRLDDSASRPPVTVFLDDNSQQSLEELSLPAGLSTELFERSGRIRRIEVTLTTSLLFSE